MTDSIFLNLIQNTAILLSFSILYEYLWVRKKTVNTIRLQISSGLIIGAICIILMLSSWELAPGIVFDTRSVILSISGLFFGAIPTIVAMFVAGVYRMTLGGDGLLMGLAVIVSSGSIGIFWNKIWSSLTMINKWLKYLLLGFVVHSTMLCCAFLLPKEDVWPTMAHLIIPLLTIYPLGNLLLGLFMSNQMQNWKAKNALNNNEDKYSQLYESINDAFVVLDMNGGIKEFNTAYRQLLGYSRDELLQLGRKDITPDEWIEFDQHIMEDEVMVHGSSEVYEKECTRKDGSLIPIEVRVYLLKDEKNEPDGFWVMVRDISLRKQIQNETETERSHLKILLETVPEMIWLKNPEGIYLSCNQNFEEFNGLAKDELIGKSDYDFYPKEIADFYWEKDLEVLNSSGRVRFVSWAVSALNGNRILTETIKSPMHDTDGKLLGVLGVSRDITEMKKVEEELLRAKEKAEESDKLKSIFLANMSHEIRTPMNAIMGFSELLVDEDLDGLEKGQYVNIIQNSGNRLLQIIDDIVDISKIELNQVTVNREEVNIFQLLSNCVEIFKQGNLNSDKLDIDLKLELPKKFKDLRVLTDSNRVQQVLDNLLGNAIKFSERGTVEVGFALIESNLQTFVEVYVKDEGYGIPKDKQKVIFERFRQGNEEKFSDGTGLGLSISKGLVELLGGDIRVESEVGKGSTFYFSIPCSNKNIASEDYKKTKKSDISLNKRSVLIAEDDYNSYLYLRKLFDGEEVSISHAHNGSMMLEMIDKSEPDLLILDMNISGRTYMECLTELQTRNFKTKIIAQSAFEVTGEEEKCLKEGCHGYFTMPIGKEDFIGEVKRVLL